MFKGTIIANTAITAGQNLPINAYLNTNSNTDYSNGVITLKTAGYYEVCANVVLTNVAVGDVTMQMYNNGEALPDATATATSSATTDYITLPIHDILRIIPALPNNNVNLSFRTSVNATVTNANITVGKIH